MDRTPRQQPSHTPPVCDWAERVSAAIDGETDSAALSETLNHARGCTSCTSLLDVARLLPRSEPLRARPLAGAALTSRERQWLSGRWTRRLLICAAIVIVAEAIPAYVRGSGLSAESHAARHLASWQIGFGVGVFVAAWISRMTYAMLALAATFAVLTVGATAIDVIGGHQGPWAESVHVVELVAVFLLWRITPAAILPRGRANRSDNPAARDPLGDHRTPEQNRPGLRLIASDRDDSPGGPRA